MLDIPHRELVELSARFSNAFRRWLDSGTPDGLTYSRLRVLEVLHCQGPAKMKTLADGLGLSARNLTTVADSLEADGLLSRVAHPTDRRATLLELTPAGMAEADEALGPRLVEISRLFDELSPTARTALARRADDARHGDGVRRHLRRMTTSDGGGARPSCSRRSSATPASTSTPTTAATSGATPRSWPPSCPPTASSGRTPTACPSGRRSSPASRAPIPRRPTLLLLGHTDVVPVNPARWSRDPFGGEIVDGEVWGRGAVDMLNQTAAMALAFADLAARADPAAAAR